MTHQNPIFSAKNIGVISGLEIIGDGLIKLPFLRALREVWPDAKIHWITTKGPTVYNGPLRETVRPLVDVIHEQPSWLLMPEDDDKAPDFDLVIDTRGRWKLALQARYHLPHKLFIAHAFGFLFSDKRPPLFSKRPERMIDRLLQMIGLAAGYLPSVTGRLPIAENLIAQAHEILPQENTYIGFSPGAGNGIKKWPLERFKAVAQQQVLKGRIPVFILGPQELDLYDDLMSAIPEAIFPLQAVGVWGTKKPKIEHTLAIGSCLNLTVTNDSGTSHMLAAVDCPLISLFGPTSATKLAPKVTHSRVLTAQSYGSADMSSIPVDSVLKAIDEVVTEIKTT